MRGDYMLSAVSAAVNAEFDKNPKCYVEIPAHGCQLPYLFVAELQQEQTPDNFRRYSRFCFFNVRYHPDDKEGSKYREMTVMRERLFECLRIIQTDDLPIRASGIRSEIVDGVLHVFADYPVRLMDSEESGPDMRVLDISEKMKE